MTAVINNKIYAKFIIYNHLNFIFLCFKLIIIHYYIPKQKKIKFKLRTKLNHSIYVQKIDDHKSFARVVYPGG